MHLLSDGDTVFALATGGRSPAASGIRGGGGPAPRGSRGGSELPLVNEVLAAGADVLTRAVVKAMLAAESVDGAGGVFPAYRDLYRRER